MRLPAASKVLRDGRDPALRAEVARIEGYPGEDFFWGLLEMMLKAKTGYTDGTGGKERQSNG